MLLYNLEVFDDTWFMIIRFQSINLSFIPLQTSLSSEYLSFFLKNSYSVKQFAFFCLLRKLLFIEFRNPCKLPKSYLY